MPLQVSERHAAMGAAAAAGIPIVLNIGDIDIERRIVDLANRVFEGNAGSAGFVTGLAFSAMGIGLVAAAWVGPLRGKWGMLAMGIGIGMISLGAQAFDVARRN